MADFRECMGGSPLEGKFCINPSKWCLVPRITGKFPLQGLAPLFSQMFAGFLVYIVLLFLHFLNQNIRIKTRWIFIQKNRALGLDNRVKDVSAQIPPETGFLMLLDVKTTSSLSYYYLLIFFVCTVCTAYQMELKTHTHHCKILGQLCLGKPTSRFFGRSYR